jgi:Icc-related predicted phosphoesterase
MAGETKMVRVAALADVHYKKDGTESFQALFQQVAQQADVLTLCGDLTDYGLPEEARLLAKDLANVRIPIIAVLGNHDFQSNRQDEVRAVLQEAGVKVLDGEAFETHGIGFAGTKGFAGGFDRRTLEPWGEPIIKQFVQEAVNETLKLESALARVHSSHRIALLHYSPILATVQGEPPEIFAFLGSSRLEEPINRYEAKIVFHGHAHRGSAEGATRTGIPVYNVSLQLLRSAFPDQPTYRVVEVAVE